MQVRSPRSVCNSSMCCPVDARNEASESNRSGPTKSRRYVSASTPGSSDATASKDMQMSMCRCNSTVPPNLTEPPTRGSCRRPVVGTAAGEVGDRGGRPGLAGVVRGDLRLLETGADRHHAGPPRPGDVVGLVDRVAGAHLGGGLGQRQLQHQRAPQVDLRRRPGGVPVGHDVVGNELQGVALALLAVDARRPPAHHHRAVVHRVVERRASHHEAVHVRDGHADLLARPGAEQMVGGGTVQVQPLPVPPVHHRQHQRPIGRRHPHMRDQPRIQDRQHLVPLIPGPRRPPPNPSPPRSRPNLARQIHLTHRPGSYRPESPVRVGLSPPCALRSPGPPQQMSSSSQQGIALLFDPHIGQNNKGCNSH